MTSADSCSLVYVSPHRTCAIVLSCPTLPGVCNLLDLLFSLNSAFATHSTAVGEATQGVDSVGRFTVVLTIIEHDVLAQQLCGSVVNLWQWQGMHGYK